MRNRLKAYGAAASVIALDRLTKWIVETRVSLADTHIVIPGFFDIVRTQNSGVAFGLFNESSFEWRTTLLVLVSVAAVVVVSAIIWRARQLDPLSLWGFALVLGGAAGNLYDRILSGRVTDFLDFYIRDYHWPAFNVADSALVVGCGLLLVGMVRPQRQAANVPRFSIFRSSTPTALWWRWRFWQGWVWPRGSPNRPASTPMRWSTWESTAPCPPSPVPS